MSFFQSCIWFIKHNNWINTRISSQHSISISQAFQKRIRISKEKLPGRSLLSESSKTYLNGGEFNKILQKSHIFPIVVTFELLLISFQHKLHNHWCRKQLIKRQKINQLLVCNLWLIDILICVELFQKVFIFELSKRRVPLLY